MAQVKERGGGGEERKEGTLADKSLDFGNRKLGLSCLSSRTDIWCCHQLSMLLLDQICSLVVFLIKLSCLIIGLLRGFNNCIILLRDKICDFSKASHLWFRALMLNFSAKVITRSSVFSLFSFNMFVSIHASMSFKQDSIASTEVTWSPAWKSSIAGRHLHRSDMPDHGLLRCQQVGTYTANTA